MEMEKAQTPLCKSPASQKSSVNVFNLKRTQKLCKDSNEFGKWWSQYLQTQYMHSSGIETPFGEKNLLFFEKLGGETVIQ